MVWMPREIDVGLWATLRGLQIGILLAPQTGMAIIWVSPQQRWGFTLKQLPPRIVSRPLTMRAPFSLAMAPAMASTPQCDALRRRLFQKSVLCGLRGERSSPPVSGATWVVRIAPQSLD